MQSNCLNGCGKRWMAAMLGLIAISSLAACNTVSGFGRDVEKVGEEMTESSEEVQN